METLTRLELGDVGAVIAAGDLPGHAFHGNQYTDQDGRVGADQRPSQFTSPYGDPMTRSQIGDTMEALAVTHPAISAALGARFHGQPEAAVGHLAGRARQGAWDLRAGDTAIELKSVHAESTSQKATLKRSEIEDKQADIAAAGLKPATAVIVWQPRGDGGAVAHVHATDGIVSGSVKKFDDLGNFEVSRDQFVNAFSAAGYGQKITASVQLEFGDVDGHAFHGNQYTGRQDAELMSAWTKPGPSAEKLTPEELSRVTARVGEIGEPSVGPLYRGMSVASLDDVRAEFKPGSVINVPAASFDSKENHASSYAMDDPWNKGEHPVFLVVPAGTKSIKMESPYPGEDESIVAGKFKVDSVEEQSGKWRSGPFTPMREWSGLVVKMSSIDV